MRGRVAGLLALGAAVLPPSAARAGAGDAILHACVGNQSGRVRIVAAGAPCKDKEYPLAWLGTDPASGGVATCRVVARLTVAGITGENADGSIDLLSYQTGVLVSVAGGSGRFDPLVVVKGLDQASPALFLATVNGNAHPTARIDVLAADGATITATLDLGNVFVTAVKYAPHTPCEPLPTEELTLSFATLAVSVPSP
jgi:type VI protein secretion system component Hcp